MLPLFQQLLQYDLWANERVLVSLEQQNGVAREMGILAHIVGAQYVWLGRLTASPCSNKLIWPEWQLDEIRVRLQALSTDWQRFITGVQNPGRLVSYKNSKNMPFQTSIQDILHHVVNHGSYHRGQIAILRRQANKTPVNTDYITYTREPGDRSR